MLHEVIQIIIVALFIKTRCTVYMVGLIPKQHCVTVFKKRT